MKVYLLRHGEVENPNNIFYGRLPGFHLSEKGRRHVRITAEKLKDKAIKKIYTSPLERAVETARIVQEVLGLNGDDVIIDDRLIESENSKWQGTDLDYFKKTVVFGMSPRTQKEMELVTDAGNRVLSVVNGPVKQVGNDAVIVSHGDPLVGVLINLTGDWSYVEHTSEQRTQKYIPKGEYVVLESNEDSWDIVFRSY
jgi:broad specificity phosphatase PhoE